MRAYCSDTDTLSIRVRMLVHADLSNFSISRNSSIDSISKMYVVEEMGYSGITECKFYKINVSSPCCSCNYMIAYNYADKDFYRLRGFKTNDFSLFYYSIIKGDNVPGLEGINTKKSRQYIFNNVRISGFDIKTAYKKYYRKNKASLYDETSCYKSMGIIINAETIYKDGKKYGK